MSDPVRAKIEQNAQMPQRAQNDAGSVEQHDLEQQILADQYLSSIDAVKRRTPLMTKLSPPGTTE